MTCQEQIEAYLRKNRVPFGVHRYVFEHAEPRAAHAEHLVDQLMVRAALIVARHTPALLVFPTSREVDLPKLGALLDDPAVRMASPGELAEAIPGCAADAIPPFGNLYGLPVYADQSLDGDQAIFFSAGSHAVTLSVGYDDYKCLANPIMAEFTHMGHQPAINSDMLVMGGL